MTRLGLSSSSSFLLPPFALCEAASAADVGHFYLLELHRLLAPQLGIAVGALRPDRRDGVAQFVIGGTGAQQRPQVVAARGEETGVELAFGGEPRSRASAAERLSHRSDHADFTATV